MISYRVVPFEASVNAHNANQKAAAQLARVIEAETATGYEYVRMELIPTHVAGNPGCFGFGATPSYTRSTPVLIFRMRES